MAVLLSLINLKNRNTKYTPTVTKVDEWTKEEIGKGATMAFGNHKLKGNWELLTISPNNKK